MKLAPKISFVNQDFVIAELCHTDLFKMIEESLASAGQGIDHPPDFRIRGHVEEWGVYVCEVRECNAYCSRAEQCTSDRHWRVDVVCTVVRPD